MYKPNVFSALQYPSYLHGVYKQLDLLQNWTSPKTVKHLRSFLRNHFKYRMRVSSGLQLSTYYYSDKLISAWFMYATNYLNVVIKRHSLTHVKYFRNTSSLQHIISSHVSNGSCSVRWNDILSKWITIMVIMIMTMMILMICA